MYKLNGYDLLMPAKIRSASNLSRNPRKAAIATYICFLTNFTEVQLTNMYRPIIGWAKCIVAHPTKIWVGHDPFGPPCSAPMLVTHWTHPCMRVQSFWYDVEHFEKTLLMT